MSSPSKSFLIKDILSNQCKIISSNESNQTKSLYYRYYLNMPVSVLKETTPGKSNIDQDMSSQLIRKFRKRRKTRAAFSTYQITALENRFSHQRYLTPPDRDQIAKELRLSAAQVITWFQNRRAKLKRHYKELKTDIQTANYRKTHTS